MDILIFGKNGQVGYELARLVKQSRYSLTAFGPSEVDFTLPEQIRTAIRDVRPDLVINAAAYTAVDKAESEPDVAMALNADAPKVIAEEAADIGCGIIHYSTDYVYDGNTGVPITEDRPARPLNEYGRTKLAGDINLLESGVPALIFRTTWVYGSRGNSFLSTMIRLMQERDALSIVSDQIGAPTWSHSIAEATMKVIEQGSEDTAAYIRERRGMYHLSCRGQTSWYGFAGAIAAWLKEQGRSVAELSPIPTEQYPTPAQRPKFSVLDNSRLQDTFGVELPQWEMAFRACVREIEL